MTTLTIVIFAAAALDLAALAVIVADVRWYRRRPRVGTYIPQRMERGPD